MLVLIDEGGDTGFKQGYPVISSAKVKIDGHKSKVFRKELTTH